MMMTAFMIMIMIACCFIFIFLLLYVSTIRTLCMIMRMGFKNNGAAFYSLTCNFDQLLL